jgi:hypothetical protein
MKTQSIRSQLIVMGEPPALIEDYLDTTSTLSIDGYWEYKKREESSNNAQVRWDARSRGAEYPVTSSYEFGSQIPGLMAHIRKRS